MFQCMHCESTNVPVTTRTELRDTTEHIVVQCTNCGFQQLDPMPTQEEMDKYYQKDTQAVDIGYKPVYHSPDTLRRVDYIEHHWWNSFKFSGDPGVHKSILDYGAGYGDFALSGKDHGLNVTGYEPSDLRRKIAADNGVVLSDSLPEGIRFDLITLFHVLEHLPNPAEFLHNLAEDNLTERGAILVEVPNANDWLLDESESYKRWCSMKCHFSYFTPKTLEDVARVAGFKEIVIEPVQRYSIVNNMNWIITGKPQMENPSYNLEEQCGDVISEVGEFFKGYAESMEVSDTLVMVLRRFRKR